MPIWVGLIFLIPLTTTACITKAIGTWNSNLNVIGFDARFHPPLPLSHASLLRLELIETERDPEIKEEKTRVKWIGFDARFLPPVPLSHASLLGLEVTETEIEKSKKKNTCQ